MPRPGTSEAPRTLRPGASPIQTGCRLLAAAVVFIVSANTFVASAASSYSWQFGGRWLLLLPWAHTSAGERFETGSIAVLALALGVAAALRLGAARVAGTALALAFVAVVATNAVRLADAGSSATYVLGRPEAAATWLCAFLAVGAALGGWGGAPALALGVAASTVLTGASAAAVIAAAPSYSFAGATTSTDSSYAAGSTAPDGSGYAGSEVGSEADNSPGDCASGWTTDLDVVTTDMHATVCADATDAVLVISLSDGSVVNVSAVAQGAGWNGQSGSTTYHVDPNVVAVYSDGSLTTDEAATGSDSSPASTSPLIELADLVQVAHDGRLEVSQLSDLTGGCGSTDSGNQLIANITSNRSQLLAAAQRLEQSGSANGLPVDEFVQSMQVSLSADQAWGAWITNEWTPWVNSGCTGNLLRTGHADYDTFIADSLQATDTKNAFVNNYDPLAGQQGQKDTWQGSDI